MRENAVVKPENQENNDGNGTPRANGGQVAHHMIRADILKGKIRPEPESEEEGSRSGQHVQEHDHRYLQNTA